MSYTVYDFSESLDRAKRKDVKRVHAAWGIQGDFSEWEGGFLLEMADDSWMYIKGWCDTTGWGCQDGIEVETFDSKPGLDALTQSEYHDRVEWDLDPGDLNRYVRGEIGPFD